MQKERLDLKPCDKMPGYFIVPGIERFSVNREGFVYDHFLDMIAVSSLNTDQVDSKTYLSVFDNPVHRMVAETFWCKDHIPSDEICIVNHLDGNIRNNRSTNLEWTTYSGNTVHAFKTGLRPDNIPVLCKNVETDEVTRFYSYWECARSLNTNGANVYNYLNRKNIHRLFLDNYLLIREGEEWPDVDIELCLLSQCKDLFVRNNNTNDAFIFANASEASRHMNVSPALISKLQKKQRELGDISITWNEWTILQLNRVEDWIRSSAKDMRQPLERCAPSARRKPCEVTVTDLKTNETRNFKSLEEFCDLIGEKKNTVQKHILVNNGIWRKNYEIKYLYKGPSTQ